MTYNLYSMDLLQIDRQNGNLFVNPQQVKYMTYNHERKEITITFIDNEEVFLSEITGSAKLQLD